MDYAGIGNNLARNSLLKIPTALCTLIPHPAGSQAYRIGTEEIRLQNRPEEKLDEKQMP